MGKTHHMDDSGELAADLPPAVRKIASFNTLLIDEATQAYPADDHDSLIRYRTESCSGSIRVTILSRVEDVTWQCPQCGLNGVISHWQGTKKVRINYFPIVWNE
jgi:predicted RNA-binding Zn-ribbon protein involved in translation (DUF1610 family)